MHIFLVYYFNCSFHFITVHLLLCLIYINFTTYGHIWASEVEQWSRICLPIQETQEM